MIVLWHRAAEDIDVLLFASNSLRVEDHQLDISHCLLRALDLDRAYVHGICFQNMRTFAASQAARLCTPGTETGAV